ncbi:MAG: TetR-like C-terminal domain-containing protein, partial [Stackebrandtia sp.]
LYGSPVPGYRAPMDTVPAAIRDTAVFGAIVSEAYHAGELITPLQIPAPPASYTVDADNVRELMPGVDDTAISRAISAWVGLYGWLGFELFGQFNNVLADRDSAFAQQIDCLSALLGLSTNVLGLGRRAPSGDPSPKVRIAGRGGIRGSVYPTRSHSAGVLGGSQPG